MVETDQFIKDIITESECEIENAPWWMSEPSYAHHYPTPIGYQQIKNDIMNDDEKQNVYPTPKKLHQPLMIQSENKNIINPGQMDQNNNDVLIEPIHYELQLIYQKLLLSSISACFISLLTLVAGTIFYKTRHITHMHFALYIIVLFATLFGIFCGIYKEKNKDKKKALRKLKCLLIYFALCCILSAVLMLFIILYLILFLINKWPNTKNNIYFSVLFGNFIFFFGGVMFWMVLVLFYIDLVSRAALKRGRIGFVIGYFNIDPDGCNDLKENSLWFRIFAIIIWFRCKFRSIQRVLTKITGINFVQLKPILSMNNGDIKNGDNEHEEEKIKAILEEGGSQDIVYGPIFIQKFTIFRNDCFQCDNYGEHEHNVTTCCKCVSVGFKTMCILILLYMFLPLWLLVICVLLISIPGSVLINVFKAICGFHCNIHTVYNMLSVFIGFVVWIYLWFWLICPHPTIYGHWNWNTQCNMWYYSMFVYVRSIIKALTAPIFD